MNPYKAALITGASSGIGETFARELAKAGLDLVLVARSEERLRALAKQLHEVYARRVEVVTADLSRPGAAARIGGAVDALGLTIDLLINNAGFGTAGPFHKQDAAREQQEIMLNAAAVVDMCHVFLPGMIARKQGGIINVASAAAFQPLPYMSVYAATKAFVLAFTEGLRGELRGSGVKATALCPGPVDTPFFEATGVDGLRKTVPRGTMMTAQAVVAACLEGFQAGRGVVVPGVAMKLMAVSGKLMPRSLMTAMTARVMRR